MPDASGIQYYDLQEKKNFSTKPKYHREQEAPIISAHLFGELSMTGLRSKPMQASPRQAM